MICSKVLQEHPSHEHSLARLSRLSCFYGGRGTVRVEWKWCLVVFRPHSPPFLCFPVHRSTGLHILEVGSRSARVCWLWDVAILPAAIECRSMKETRQSSRLQRRTTRQRCNCVAVWKRQWQWIFTWRKQQKFTANLSQASTLPFCALRGCGKRIKL